MSQRMKLTPPSIAMITAMAMRRGEMAKRFRASSRSQPERHMPSQKRGIQGDPCSPTSAPPPFCHPGQCPLPFLGERLNGGRMASPVA